MCPPRPVGGPFASQTASKEGPTELLPRLKRKTSEPRITRMARIEKEGDRRARQAPARRPPRNLSFLHPCHPCNPWLLFFLAAALLSMEKADRARNSARRDLRPGPGSVTTEGGTATSTSSREGGRSHGATSHLPGRSCRP